MKVAELLLEYSPSNRRPTYDDDQKVVLGATKDWMARLGATKDDIKAAFTKAKSLPSYQALIDAGMKDITSDKTAANGTFNFLKPNGKFTRNWKGGDAKPEKYMVYATGQIRSQSDDAPTRLASPKPHGKLGKPVDSIEMFYDAAFKSLAKTAARRAKMNEDLTSDEKKALRTDFKEWSGGFDPSECPEADVRKYIKSAISTSIDERAAQEYLMSLQ